MVGWMGYEKIGWMNEPVSDGVHSGWKGGRMVETATCRTSYHNLLRPTLEVTYTMLLSAGDPRSLLQQLTAKVVLYTRTRSVGSGRMTDSSNWLLHTHTNIHDRTTTSVLSWSVYLYIVVALEQELRSVLC